MNDPTALRINVIGKAASGKSTVIEYLSKEMGFSVYRPSDSIRNYAKANNIVLTGRQSYVDINKTMHTIDPLFMIKPVLECNEPRLLIDGLRAPGNIEILKQQVGLITLALVCPDETRYGRIMSRPSRDGTVIKTFEDFIKDEDADTSVDPWLPNVESAINMADATFDSSKPIEDVLSEIRKYIESM